MNTLEERIVDELQAERDLVPTARPGTMPEAPGRWPRYVGVAVALMVVGLGASTVIQRGRADQALAAVKAGEIVIDASVVLPVDGEVGTVESQGGTLTVIAGSPAPPMAVDLDVEGTEQPLLALAPIWDEPIWPGDVPVVYIGTVGGRSVFVHGNGTLGLLTQVKVDLGLQPRTEHVCITVGDSTPRDGTIDPIGAAGFCAGSDQLTFGGQFDSERGMEDGWWTTWIDVPPGTALVTLAIDDEGFAWQRPVAETVFFELDERPNGPVTLTAIGVDGQELATELLTDNVFPNG